MISRREVVTAGVLGTLAAAPVDAGSSQSSQDDAQTRQILNRMQNELQRIHGTLESGLRGPGLAVGLLAELRNRFSTHLRATGKFPDFLEIGSDVFYDVYDWHIRHNQPIQITRISEQRFSIQWMFTQLVVRFEQDPRFIGIPFDRG